MEDQSITQSVWATTGPDLPGLLAQMLAATDQEAIWNSAVKYFRSLGFAQVLYGYSPDSQGSILGSPEDFLVMATVPEAVVQELLAREHYRQSMTFHWALHNVGIAKWSRTAAECGLRHDFQLSDEAQEFFFRTGLMTGCCIGFARAPTRGRAVVALIGPPDVPQSTVDALIDAQDDVLFSVAAVMHRCIASLPLRIVGRQLTVRQREVLEWVANGKTIADIAVILNISKPTVEKHLRLAREALGVETTAHALIKASSLNQVFTPSR